MSISVAMATMFAMLIPTVTTQMVLIFVPAKNTGDGQSCQGE